MLRSDGTPASSALTGFLPGGTATETVTGPAVHKVVSFTDPFVLAQVTAPNGHRFFCTGNDGKVDEKEFNDAVTTCKKWTRGKRTDIQCKRMVIDIIDDNLYKTSKGWFSDWYARTKKEVGK